MRDETFTRCVNIDWLEVYVLESNDRYPCNADYYRRQGYLVRERDYGTRVYKEMFEIVDEMNNPLLEIRRNPASGASEFHGLFEQSSHIRLPNWMLYQGNPIDFLREFLIKHDYIFKRIYRIDIAYDFEYFDTGDKPARFARRYLEGQYRKINQCKLAAFGKDDWNQCEWESLSWGSRTSMVSTKLYNKTLELAAAKNSKPYIVTSWMIHGLIDNPCSMTKRDTKGNLYKPDIWRVEFSMKSAADGWIVIEMQNGKKVKKQTIPHRLDMFDSKEKLWQRFQDLAYHYFRFKHKEYLDSTKAIANIALATVNSDAERPLQRKDRCRDKVLFYWDAHHVFTQLSTAPTPSKPKHTDDILRRRLAQYRQETSDMKVRDACDIILKRLEKFETFRFVPLGDNKEAKALQLALMAKIGGDERDALAILEEIKQLLDNDMLL